VISNTDPSFEDFKNESFKLSNKIVEYIKRAVNKQDSSVVCATLVCVSMHLLRCCFINERLAGGQDQLNTFIDCIISPTLDRLKNEYYVNSQEGYIR
jgi:hypothetical protein